MHRTVWFVGLLMLIVCFTAGVLMSRTQFNLNEDVDETSPPSESSTQTGVLGQHAEQTNAPAVAAEHVEPTRNKPDTWSSIPGYSKDEVVLHDNMPPQVHFDLDNAFQDDEGVYQADLPGGYRAHLTLDPTVQEELESVYRRYEVPHAGFAAIEPRTGRVLALVSHESASDSKGTVAVQSFAPSASLFKVITAAALIEDEGLRPGSQVCYIGETSKLPADLQIKSTTGRDRQCTTFAQAFGESNNPVFANLSYKNLNSNKLGIWAARFGYNEAIPFQIPIQPSTSRIPDEPVEMARAAAGFWHTHLSTIHAALIMSAIGNGGVMMRPNIIEKLYNRDGELVYDFNATPYKRIMKEETARHLSTMMVHTTSVGTGRKYFHNADGLPEDGFTTGGKTGTLSDNSPYLMYSWFAGLAPMEGPQFAFAALVCNPMKWRIKGSYAALEGLRALVSSKNAAEPPETDSSDEGNPDIGNEAEETDNPTEGLEIEKHHIIKPDPEAQDDE